jgi:hypothetical protein
VPDLPLATEQAVANGQSVGMGLGLGRVIHEPEKGQHWRGVWTITRKRVISRGNRMEPGILGVEPSSSGDRLSFALVSMPSGPVPDRLAAAQPRGNQRQGHEHREQGEE